MDLDVEAVCIKSISLKKHKFIKIKLKKKLLIMKNNKFGPDTSFQKEITINHTVTSNVHYAH